MPYGGVNGVTRYIRRRFFKKWPDPSAEPEAHPLSSARTSLRKPRQGFGAGAERRNMIRRAPGKLRNSFPVDEASLSHLGIRRAVEFIQEHHSTTLDLEQAAAEACLSKYHFSRLFHRMVGMPYQDYLTRIRIEEAKQLLKQTPYLSLTRIAIRVGFGTLRNFEGQFKKLTRRSPSEYREMPLVPIS